MSGKCELCGRTLQFGHNVSHSKRRTNRCWLLNTHKVKMVVGGRQKRLNVCTRCLRTQRKLGH